ncbi:glycosyl transferase [Cutibacterium acnes]|nr:glycosyl transferase [Cutibacterium acnes]
MRKLLFHLGASRAISDDDELGVGDVSEVGHIGDPFLGS